MKLVELTQPNGKKVFVNINHISRVRHRLPSDEKNVNCVLELGSGMQAVQESVDHAVELIRDLAEEDES